MRTTQKRPEVIARFLEEAKLAMDLKSPHVAKVLDVGRRPLSGVPYMIVEILDGKDLATLLDRDGVMSPVLAIDYLLQAAEGLAEVHRAGLVHRDLKPKSLFLAQQAEGPPIIKILEVGSVKAREELDLRYMAPELHRGADGDHHADIWALGIMLYEMLTGHPPFDTVETISEKATPLIEAYNPGAPPGLSAIVQRCLEKDPKRRYVTVGAFAQALSALGLESNKPIESASLIEVMPPSRREVSVVAPAKLAPIPGLSKSVPLPPEPSPKPQKKRGSGIFLALFLALVIGGSMVGYDFYRRKHLPAPPPPPAPKPAVTASASASASSASPEIEDAAAAAPPPPSAAPDASVPRPPRKRRPRSSPPAP